MYCVVKYQISNIKYCRVVNIETICYLNIKRFDYMYVMFGLVDLNPPGFYIRKGESWVNVEIAGQWPHKCLHRSDKETKEWGREPIHTGIGQIKKQLRPNERSKTIFTELQLVQILRIRPGSSFCDIRVFGLNKASGFFYMFILNTLNKIL